MSSLCPHLHHYNCTSAMADTSSFPICHFLINLLSRYGACSSFTLCLFHCNINTELLHHSLVQLILSFFSVCQVHLCTLAMDRLSKRKAITRGAHVQSDPLEGLIQAGICVLPGRKGSGSPDSKIRYRCKPDSNTALEDWICPPKCIAWNTQFHCVVGLFHVMELE